MNYISEFLKQYGFEIAFTIFSAILAFIGVRIRALFQEKFDNAEKRKVVRSCVKAVEQLYKDLHGAEKLEKAKASILQILQEKGIAISDIEMDMLIEEVVMEMNKTKEVIFEEVEE